MAYSQVPSQGLVHLFIPCRVSFTFPHFFEATWYIRGVAALKMSPPDSGRGLTFAEPRTSRDPPLVRPRNVGTS